MIELFYISFLNEWMTFPLRHVLLLLLKPYCDSFQMRKPLAQTHHLRIMEAYLTEIEGSILSPISNKLGRLWKVDLFLKRTFVRSMQVHYFLLQGQWCDAKHQLNISENKTNKLRNNRSLTIVGLCAFVE